RVNQIQPAGKSNTGPCDAHLNHFLCPLNVLTLPNLCIVQLLRMNVNGSIADLEVRLLSPSSGSFLFPGKRQNIVVLQPWPDLMLVLAHVDIGRQVVSKTEGIARGDGCVRKETEDRVWNGGIPGGVEVGLVAVEVDSDVVGASTVGFGVEGLRNVTEEVNDKLEGLETNN